MYELFKIIFESPELRNDIDNYHFCQHTGDVWKCIDYVLKSRENYHLRTSEKRILVKVLESYDIKDFRANLILSNKKVYSNTEEESRNDLFDQLEIGKILEGDVVRITDFGAFVDIGLHDDGLIHISKMSREFVKNPNDILNVGDLIKCYVDGIDLETQKVQLSLIKQ